MAISKAPFFIGIRAGASCSHAGVDSKETIATQRGGMWGLLGVHEKKLTIKLCTQACFERLQNKYSTKNGQSWYLPFLDLFLQA